MKWEYLTETYSPNMGMFKDWLDHYGNEGWELVQALPIGSRYMRGIFKRLKND